MDAPRPQFRLIHDEEVGVLPRDTLHYVPVLQSQAGEFDALASASDSVWEHITPLVTFVARRREPGAEPRKATTVAGWAKRARAALSTHCFYADLVRAEPTEPLLKPNQST